MAHNLAEMFGDEAQKTNGTGHMIAWAGNTPWHGLGTKVDGLMTTHEALTLAGLDWTVEKRPLTYNHNDEWHVVPETYAVVREDGLPLTRNGKAVGRVFTCLQNVDALSFMDDLLQSHEAAIEVAGALGNGEHVWVLARLPDVFKVGSGDEMHAYVLISNTHDGTGSVKFLLTPIRVVCNNTLTLALGMNTTRYNMRHTSKMGERIDEARMALGLVRQGMGEWTEMANGLINVEMGVEDMNDYFIDTLGLSYKKDEPEVLTTRSSNILSSVHQVLVRPTNMVGGMEGTAWAAYNAVTEYIVHEATSLRNGEKSLKRMESALFGTLSKTKQKAWTNAMEMMA